MNKGIMLLAMFGILSGCATTQGSGGAASSMVRESSTSNGAWRLATTKAADEAIRPTTEACALNGATEAQIGACTHTRLLTAWPDAQPGAVDCTGLLGSRPTATCLLDFGYWNYISGLLARPKRGNWATFELNENALFEDWFTAMHHVCDPTGTRSDAAFYDCANREARELLSVDDDEALPGCPEAKDRTLHMICYWDASYNKYVLAQLAKL